MPKSIENLFVFLLMSSLLCACNMIGDKVIERGSLKVYFSESTEEKIAVKFADFWINRKYVGNRPQNIKITEGESYQVFQIRLILRENFKSTTEINFEELKLLGQIQHELNSTVFDKKKCELVICDNKFQTINTPIPLYSKK